MNIALTALFTIVSLFAALFLVSRYRKATPAQRPQILWAACGALAIVGAAFLLYAFR